MTSNLDRLEALVARLLAAIDAERTGPPDVELFAADPGHVAAGELIESAWGNSVVDTLGPISTLWPPNLSVFQHLNGMKTDVGNLQTAQVRDSEADQYASVTIPGVTDAATASFTDWLTTGVTIPTWATRAHITTTVAGLYELTQASSWELLTRIGFNQGPTMPIADFKALSSRSTVTYTQTTPCNTANLTIGVMVRRTIGNGVLRVDGSCTCTFTIRYDA